MCKTFCVNGENFLDKKIIIPLFWQKSAIQQNGKSDGIIISPQTLKPFTAPFSEYSGKERLNMIKPAVTILRADIFIM